MEITARSWCSVIQIIDFNKTNDLWYIFNVLKSDPARFVTLITTVGISVPMYNNLDASTISGFIKKLTFSRLIRLYVNSYDKRLLSDNVNDRVFIDRNGDRLLIKQPNGLYQFSPKGIQE